MLLIFLFNIRVICFITISVIWCCCYAHGSIIDLTNSEMKRMTNVSENATLADLDRCVMRWDAKRDAPWSTKTPNYETHTIITIELSDIN